MPPSHPCTIKTFQSYLQSSAFLSSISQHLQSFTCNTLHNPNHVKPHDGFFKKSMYRADVAAEFFQLALPSQVLNIIDLNTLQYVNANFLDNTLGEGTVDLLYTVNFKGKTGYLWILCEHQSSQDNTITLRMQKYMLRICTQHLKENPGTKLPLIYPMLAYSGKPHYSSSLSLYLDFPTAHLDPPAPHITHYLDVH